MIEKYESNSLFCFWLYNHRVLLYVYNRGSYTYSLVILLRKLTVVALGMLVSFIFFSKGPYYCDQCFLILFTVYCNHGYTVLNFFKKNLNKQLTSSNTYNPPVNV